MLKKITFLSVSGLVALILVFTFGVGHLSAAGKAHKFGVALGWVVNDFGVACKETIVAELKDTFPGCKVLVADANYDAALQVSQIDNYITMKVDAIFITPADPTALVGIIEKADSAGIPVFCGDSLPIGAPVKTVAMSSNFTMGFENGLYIARRLGGKGNMATINLPENTSWYERTIGLYYALKRYPDVKIVAEHMYVPGAVGALTPEEAARAMLEAHPEINAMWGSWDGAAIAMAEAAKALKRDDIFVTGIDGFEQSLDYIHKGTPLATTCGQSPREMMRSIVKSADRYFKGERIPYLIITPVYRFTKDRVPPPGVGPYGYDDPEYIKKHPDKMQRAM